jgi:hypothetical protein
MLDSTHPVLVVVLSYVGSMPGYAGSVPAFPNVVHWRVRSSSPAGRRRSI